MPGTLRPDFWTYSTPGMAELTMDKLPNYVTYQQAGLMDQSCQLLVGYLLSPALHTQYAGVLCACQPAHITALVSDVTARRLLG